MNMVMYAICSCVQGEWWPWPNSISSSPSVALDRAIANYDWIATEAPQINPTYPAGKGREAKVRWFRRHGYRCRKVRVVVEVEEPR
jgi:hypothetical protein